VLKGAAVNRYVFRLQQSRDIEKFNLLKEQRLIYRLALGQPNQEDLVEFLAKGGSALTEALRPLALDFSAFSREVAATNDRDAQSPREEGLIEPVEPHALIVAAKPSGVAA